MVDRGEAIRRRWLHRVATTVCREPGGRILVHRRPDHVSRFPGQYNWLVGGAVGVGETYPAAASRELAEELGVHAPTRFLFKYLCRGVISPYWLGLHEAVLNEPVVPDASEVAWRAWLTPVELRAAMHDTAFVPDARDAFDRYQAEKGVHAAPCHGTRRSQRVPNSHPDRSQLGLCRRPLVRSTVSPWRDRRSERRAVVVPGSPRRLRRPSRGGGRSGSPGCVRDGSRPRRPRAPDGRSSGFRSDGAGRPVEPGDRGRHRRTDRSAHAARRLPSPPRRAVSQGR